MTSEQKIKILEKNNRILREALDIAKNRIDGLKREVKELQNYIKNDLARNNSVSKT
jgi:polyhydroxyalkanoate synthesis regulator phasin